MSNIDEEEIIKRFEAISEFKAAPEIAARDIARVRQGLSEQARRQGTGQQSIWRTIMKSTVTKLGAVAVLIVAVVLSLTFLDKSATRAYAIEQTVEASHSVQYLHIRAITPLHEDEPVEAWLEFGQDGQPRNMRLNLPDWMAPGGGAREVIWKDNKRQEWLKEKNIFATTEDESSAAQVLKMIESLDPKLAVERLQEKQQQGKVKVVISEPTDKAEPIVVTATSIEGDDSPFQRMVLFIDQATRLVNSIELYKLKDGEYKYVRMLEYCDYNQPIDARMFKLEDIPADAMRIDQVTQEIGLAQGELGNEEIAVEVVRQYFEALIAEDYDEAGRLFSGMSARGLKQRFGKGKFLRIVSIDKPIHSESDNRLRVPCELEVEVDGAKSVVQLHPYVRPVGGQTDRWTIEGGF